MIKLIAFLDVESSGLFKPGAPDEDQPHLLQISTKLVTSDRKRVSRMTRLIRPSGWAIEPQAEAVHGISDYIASQAGVDLAEAMHELKATIENATRIVGFNLFGFDAKVIELSIQRCLGTGHWWAKKRSVMWCAMEKAKDVLKLPGRYDDYKFPSLPEAVTGLSEDHHWASVHDAEYDVDALEMVYWKLIDLGVT